MNKKKLKKKLGTVDEQFTVLIHCSNPEMGCTDCWLNPETGKCIYGGPFTGFVKVWN